MSIIVPISVCKEIEMIQKGKKLCKREKIIPDSKLLNEAKKNFNLLIEAASTEPLHSFLNKGSKKLVILKEFHPTSIYPHDYRRGYLELTVETNHPGIFFWNDLEDEKKIIFNERVSIDDLITWHLCPLRRLAELTEKKIWMIIKNNLRNWRNK